MPAKVISYEGSADFVHCRSQKFDTTSESIRHRIKFLVLAPVYIDGNSGSAAHLRGVVTGLSKNHKVHVIASSRDKNHSQINFKRIYYKGGICNFFITYIHLIYLSLHELLFKQIDVIYERETIFIIGTIIGKIFNKQVILEMNGLNKEIETIRNKRSLTIRFIDLISVINANLATNIVVGSPKLRDILIEEYRVNENKICVIENGVNTDIFKPISNAKEILHSDKDFFYVGFIGTLAEWQGIDNIIDAALHIADKVPCAKFVIVGGPQNMVEMYKNISKQKNIQNILFIGEIPYENIPIYINSFDVCITLKMELKSGYSATKLYEYMACNKPIVASNTHGHKILKEYNAGILVNQNNPSEVSEAIIKLYHNKSYGEELGNNGLNAVNKKYTWERVANDIVKLCIKS